MRNTALALLTTLFLAGTAAAQDPAAPAAAPAAPAKPPVPAKPASPALPDPAGSPAAGATPATKKTDADRAAPLVEELRATFDFETKQAERIQSRGSIAPDRIDDITRARERATDLAKVQMERVEKVMADLKAGKSDLEDLLDEILALRDIAERGSEQIADVLTHDARTEETLQKIAERFEEIEDAADEVAETLAEDRDEGFELTVNTDEGSVHIRAGGSDRVFYGSPVVVKDGETVNDAVSFFDAVTVHGRVLGDAVAIGNDVVVGKTGHVEGDAASIFGRVIVDEGGKVDGEQISLGAGALTSVLRHGPPVPPQPLPTRMGVSLLKAGAQFLCFFLLGLLAIAIFPRRVEVVADALGNHPVKAGALGVLAAIAFLPITILLVVTIVGILLIPLFWLAYPVFGFFGYVALALLIGRRLPTSVQPTNTALLALGAAVIVAVGLVPILGGLVWFLAGFFALGAALMTRFGQDRGNGGGASGVPQDLASIA